MPSLVKAISKIFGGGSKKSKAADGNHYPGTPSSFPIDAKKIEKEKKKAQKNASTRKRGKETTTSTSFSSGPHSAEIRIPGKVYLPVSDKNNNNALQQRTNNGSSNNKKTNDDNVYLGQIVTIPLTENHQKLNSPMNSGNGRVKHMHNFHLHHSSTSAAAATNSSFPAKHSSTLPPGPNSRSQRYFSDDDDSENQGGVVTNIKNPAIATHHPYSSTFDRHQFDNDNGFSLSAPPNLAAYLGTPTSSSDFCLSSDVEDEEYNRVKHGYSAGLLRPIAYSTSTEDESALFPALEGKGTGSVTSPTGSDGMMVEAEKSSAQAATDILRRQQQQQHNQRPSSVGQVLTVSGPLHKQQQPQQHHTKAITTDGEDLFSPTNLRSPQQPSRIIGNTTTSTNNLMSTNSRFFPSQLQSPVPRTSSKVNSSQSDAFGFDEFVVNDWPPTIAAEHIVSAPPTNNTQVVQRRANSNKNIISFDGGDMGNHNNPSLPNVFAASDAAAASMKHFKNSSGDSVASAPLDELMAANRPSLNRVVASPPARASRSVAVPSRPSPSSYRSQVGSSTRIANAQLLDKLERDLRDRNFGSATNSINNSQRNSSSLLSGSSKGVSATSTSNTKRPHRSTNLSSDFDLFRRGDSANQNPDQWLMEEVSDTLGPRGIAADLESLSGKSARSKTDRSTGGKSHRSHKSRSNKKNLPSSGNSVTSRTSNFSTHSHMSEASRSVANDLLRLEMQLAMVGHDRAGGNGTSSSSIVEPAPITTSSTLSVGGGNGSSSYRSKRGVSGRHNRSSPSSSSKKTVVAPPGKLGLILANKSDGRGTVVSGVRAGSALAESITIGDRIIAVDGEDVSYMNVAELTTIMSRKSDFHRKLSVLSFSRSSAPSPVSRSRDMGALS